MNLGPDFALSPSAWGAVVDYDRWTDRRVPKEGIAIHYGGGANIAGDPDRAASAGYDWPSRAVEEYMLQRWERYHLSKGWRGLAYSWAMGQSGTLYRARGWNIGGGHLGDIDGDGVSNNAEILAVVAILGAGQSPTDAMLETFEDFRAWAETESGRSLYLWGHKEVQTKPTACPGETSMMPYVRANRNSDQPVPEPPGDDPLSALPTLKQTWPDNPAQEGSKERTDVRRLQALLAVAGEVASDTFDSAHRPDGLFGPGTRAAVVRFQDSHGLVTDGIVGEHTWHHLLGIADN